MVATITEQIQKYKYNTNTKTQTLAKENVWREMSQYFSQFLEFFVGGRRHFLPFSPVSNSICSTNPTNPNVGQGRAADRHVLLVATSFHLPAQSLTKMKYGAGGSCYLPQRTNFLSA